MIEHSRENWRAKWHMASNGASSKHSETNNKSYVGVVFVVVVVVVLVFLLLLWVFFVVF